MNTFLLTLEGELIRNANPERARAMEAYMKNRFAFFGITSPERKELFGPFMDRNHLPDHASIKTHIHWLWKQPQREFHYFGQELFAKYKKKFEADDITLMEYMIAHQSWWDTVDFISVHLVGNYMKLHPEVRLKTLNNWLKSDNIWLQRASILYQLKCKKETDVLWMEKAIEYLIGGKEFFINKAIGWVLREYSRTDPQWVETFVDAHPKLSNLSKKEALRLIK